jgi:hypothetical protein
MCSSSVREETTCGVERRSLTGGRVMGMILDGLPGLLPDSRRLDGADGLI